MGKLILFLITKDTTMFAKRLALKNNMVFGNGLKRHFGYTTLHANTN